MSNKNYLNSFLGEFQIKVCVICNVKTHIQVKKKKSNISNLDEQIYKFIVKFLKIEILFLPTRKIIIVVRSMNFIVVRIFLLFKYTFNLIFPQSNLILNFAKYISFSIYVTKND